MKFTRTLRLALPFLMLSLAIGSTPARAADTVTVNPETLRQWVTSNNLGVVEALSQLHLAKEKVNVDYANLLPSLNLGGLVQSKSGLILSSITFLLPFLMPSNWINVRTDRALFESEKISYRIVQLNAYAAALETYYAILANQAILAVNVEQEKNLSAIAKIVEQGVKVGTVTKRDLLVAQAQTLAAHEQMLKTREMIGGEIVALKQAMGIPLATELVLAASDVEETEAEKGSADAAIARANTIAPELKQLGLMQLASNHAKWSQVFAFVQSPSIGAQSTVGSDGRYANVSLGKMIPRGSLNFGFATFPSYQMAQTNVELLRIRLAETELATQTTVATAHQALFEAKARLETALAAERNFQEVYAVDVQRFGFGTLGLTEVLLDQNALNAAAIVRVAARLDQNLQRVVLNRALLSEGFAEIPGCANDEEAKKQTGFGRFLRSVFKSKKGLVTLDQLCRVPAPTAPAESPSA